jgi:uncharacterized protein (TIGR02246 family)
MSSVPPGDASSDVRDTLAIRALCERYAQAVDAGDSAVFSGLFTSDGHLVANYLGEVHFDGREQLAQVPVQAHAEAATTMHVIGNHLAEVDGDSATGVTYCIANHLVDDRTNLVMMVRYDDRYRRSPDGEWLIADRRVDVRWTETHQVDPRTE